MDKSIASWFDIVTFVITLAAVGFSAIQSWLAKESLDAAKKSIDDATRSRQLSILPKMHGVIWAQILIDGWIDKMEELKAQTRKAVDSKDEILLSSVAKKSPKSPQDARLKRFMYDSAPESLQQILMSGAQYYFDAGSPAAYLWSESDGANWSYAESIVERYDDSLLALKELKGMIGDMIPSVILSSPASINDRDFLVE